MLARRLIPFILAALFGQTSAFGQARTQLDLDSFEKVWTTVRDKHWQVKPAGLDWQAIHDEYRPRVERAESHDEARAVIQEMLGRLKQSHFAIIPAVVYSVLDDQGEGPGVTGIDVRVLGGHAVVTSVDPGSPAAQQGVRPGWQVDQIHGVDLEPLVRQARSNPAIHELQLTRAMVARLTGPIGGTLDAVFLDAAGKTVHVTLDLTAPRGTFSAFGNLPAQFVWFESKKIGSTAYVRFNMFLDLPHVMAGFQQTVENCKACDGLIIDLRGNPGGIGGMAMGMAGFLVDKPNQRLGTMYLRDSTLNFVVNPRADVFSGPVALLVDGCSASTSEIFAGGLKDLGRARVFGTLTAAAALPSEFERLPNGDGFQYAVANYVSQGGQPLEGLGVFSDVVVELTREALLAGHDPVVDAAMSWIRSREKAMNRRVLLILLAAAGAGFAADPLLVPILDRYVQVTGGKQAYQKRKSEIAHGTVEYAAIGIKGSLTRYAAEPDKYYVTLDIEGLGKVETGVNGPIAWENSAILGPRVKTGVERAEAIREGNMNSTVNWRKLYPKVENAGIETIDGEECYKVVMTPDEGQPLTGYYQKKSGLQVKLTTVSTTQMGDIPVEMIASDYKDFGGILEPAKVIQKAGPQEFTMTLERVEVNPAIPPQTFALPDEVRRLVDKAEAK